MLAHVGAQGVFGLAFHVTYITAERFFRMEGILMDMQTVFSQKHFPTRGTAKFF